MLALVHPVLLRIGPLLLPSYGAVAALGVLCALALALHTARIVGVDRDQIWNLCILSLFAALAVSRLVLIVMNWTLIRVHPSWLLGLAMIHSPLLAALGAAGALAAGAFYVRSKKMNAADAADALAPAILLGLAFEQAGALLAGSGYGTETSVRWAVTFTNPLAERWSGTPLFTPLHPVQAYAALCFAAIAAAIVSLIAHRRQRGDAAGAALMAWGVAAFVTEFWRDPEGRGALFGGAIDLPQAAAVAGILLGAFVLRLVRSRALPRGAA